ncbi:SUMO-activating enzyme subunit 1 [Scaptodrosophila lebanonensis]|uniref:SUMO-activating enzyme subunit 1 n=1 Tax=Drosophila lebanonensis TaxID=7225 RepID=A0A6J2T3H0_DROLE|nr:SUMO-activating enzyme subunit 1 [Scaptodrosophila lebanonensis]
MAMEMDSAPNEVGVELTDTENELYDRQIRLWGLESQKRLRTAKVLISGLNGLGAEITKNIILSGVNLVKLHDDKLVTEEDFCSQFLSAREKIGTNRAEASLDRARALNPMVEISADTQPLKDMGAEYFGQFDVIVVSGENNAELLRIDSICRELGVKFFATDVWGMFGFYFASLQTHRYVENIIKHKIISKPNEKQKTEIISTPVQFEVEYPAYSTWLDFDINAPSYQRKIKRNGPGIVLLRILQEFRDVNKRDPSFKTREADINKLKKIRDGIASKSTITDDAIGMLFAQVSPAAAVVGGVVSQEIIKVVTKMEAPHRNLFIFDPETCVGYVEPIGVN